MDSSAPKTSFSQSVAAPASQAIVPFEPYPSDFNLAVERLKKDFGSVVSDLAVSILEGGAEDLRTYGAAIAVDLGRVFEAPPERREAITKELIGQLRAVAEINRIRTNVASFKAFERAVGMIARFAGVAINVASVNVPGLLNSTMSALLVK